MRTSTTIFRPRRWVAFRRSWTISAALAWTLAAVGAAEKTGPVSPHFTNSPASALIHKLEPASPTTRQSAGLSISHEYQWVPELGALRIESKVTNKGKTAAAGKGLRVVELVFQLRAPGDGSGFERLTYRNAEWYGSTFWTGPDWTRVGKDWHHPGQETPSVRRFQAPRDGRVTVTGRVHKLHLAGDGVRLNILHGAKELWRAEIDGDDAKGAEPRLTLDVKKGDALRFVVHKRGAISCDTTHWDPVVAYVGGEAFQASKAFSTKQGNGGWFYEMPAAGPPPPTMHGLRRDLSLHEASLTAGREFVLTPRDALPFVVIADEANQSGVALALDDVGAWTFRAALTVEGLLRVSFEADAGKETSSLTRGGERKLPTVVLGAHDGAWTAALPLLQRLIEPGKLPQSRGSRTGSATETQGNPFNRPAGTLSPSEGERDGVRGRAAFPRPFLVQDSRSESQSLLTSAATKHEVSERRNSQANFLLPNFRRHVRAAYQDLTASLARAPELDLLLMAQAEWRCDDKLTDAVESHITAVKDHLERSRQLLADLQRGQAAGFLAREAARLGKLTAAADASAPDLDSLRRLYLQTRLLKRDIALQNPLLDFDQLLFCKRRPPTYSHLVGQYFGWRQQPGGSLFVLEQAGRSLKTRDVVGSQLPRGNFLEPRLAYDGRRIAFSFVACPDQTPDSRALPVNEEGTDDAYFHLYEINTDGSGLRQLTRGRYDDLMPCYLPDGGLAFCSTRRRGYSRCFGPNFSQRWHSYTLHRLDGDQIRILSVNDVNEWFPAVASSGEILFARWDYIDRDAVTHQNLWSARPDGSNPMAVWGNATTKPHCTFQAKPVPGSRKIMFIASAHHAITGGPVCLVDPAVDANSLEAITRLTPGPFPEAESTNIPEYYESPWPLSEKYFLAAYSSERLRFEGEQISGHPNPDNALGLYLLDAAGNRELLYRDPLISSTSPMPLSPQPAPPALASALDPALADSGEMIVSDIYDGLGGIPRGSIKEIRVIQILPKSTWLANQPRIGCAGEENARAILGTVPVEPDGSARFLVPARKPVLLQALDADGFALQTMRSTTYLQPGERVSCTGCHEHRMKAAPSPRPLLAMQRPASRLTPGELGGGTFSFVRVVQPVLDRHCVSCHGAQRKDGNVDLGGQPFNGFTKSYWALYGNLEDFTGHKNHGELAATALVPRFGQRNQVQTTPPGGQYGARGSRLVKLLRQGHYEAKLDDREMRRLAAWIDCNAIFYGTYDPDEQARQLAGEAIAMPEVQ